jgi:ketosteroid isomerase-like protein
MFGWLTSVLLRRSIRRLNEGDIAPSVSRYADDAVLVFPGESSWAGEYRGKEAIEGFYQRIAAVPLHFDIEDIVVHGWPWSSTVCVRCTDHARDPEGKIVYSNRAVIYARSRWGKIYYHELYEDTQKTAEFDRNQEARSAA